MNQLTNRRLIVAVAALLIVALGVSIALGVTLGGDRLSDGSGAGPITTAAGTGDYRPSTAVGYNGNVAADYAPTENLKPVSSYNDIVTYLTSQVSQYDGVKLTQNFTVDTYAAGTQTFRYVWPAGKIFDGCGYTITTKLFSNQLMKYLEEEDQNGSGDGRRAAATGKESANLPFGRTTMYMAGLFRENEGTIRNVNIKMSSTDGGNQTYHFYNAYSGDTSITDAPTSATEADGGRYYWSQRGYGIGGVVGINRQNAVIENISVDYSYAECGSYFLAKETKIKESGSTGYQNSWGYEHVLFGGVAAQTAGTIRNSSVNWDTDVSVFSRGSREGNSIHSKGGVPRAYAGGFAATVGSGGVIECVTLTGSGSLYAAAANGACSAYVGLTNAKHYRDYFGIAGGICGLNSGNGNLGDTGYGSDGKSGIVRNVLSAWTGNVSGTSGGRFTTGTREFSNDRGLWNSAPRTNGDGAYNLGNYAYWTRNNDNGNIHNLRKDSTISAHLGVKGNVNVFDTKYEVYKAVSYQSGSWGSHDNLNPSAFVGWNGTVLFGAQGNIVDNGLGQRTCSDVYYVNRELSPLNVHGKTNRYMAALMTFGLGDGGGAEVQCERLDAISPNWTVLTSSVDDDALVEYGWKTNSSGVAVPTMIYKVKNTARANAMLWSAKRSLNNGAAVEVSGYTAIDGITDIDQLRDNVEIEALTSSYDVAASIGQSKVTFATGQAMYYDSSKATYSNDGATENALTGTTIPAKQFNNSPVAVLFMPMGTDANNLGATNIRVAESMTYQFGQQVLTRNEAKGVGTYSIYFAATIDGTRNDAIAYCDNDLRRVCYTKDDVSSPNRSQPVMFQQTIDPCQVTVSGLKVTDGTALDELVYRGSNGYPFQATLTLFQSYNLPTTVVLAYETAAGVAMTNVPANAGAYVVKPVAITGSVGADGKSPNFIVADDSETVSYTIQQKALTGKVQQYNTEFTYNGQLQYPAFNDHAVYPNQVGQLAVWFDGIVSSDTGVIVKYSPVVTDGFAIDMGIDAASYEISYGLSGLHRNNYKLLDSDGTEVTEVKTTYRINKRSFEIRVTEGMRSQVYTGKDIYLKDVVIWELEDADADSNRGVLEQDKESVGKSVMLSTENGATKVVNAGTYSIWYQYQTTTSNYQPIQRAQVSGENSKLVIIPRKVRVQPQITGDGDGHHFKYNGEGRFNLTGMSFTGQMGDAPLDADYGVVSLDSPFFFESIIATYTNVDDETETFSNPLNNMDRNNLPAHVGTYKIRLECVDTNYLISLDRVDVEGAQAFTSVELSDQLVIEKYEMVLNAPQFVREFRRLNKVWIGEWSYPFDVADAKGIFDAGSDHVNYEAQYYSLANELSVTPAAGLAWAAKDGDVKATLWSSSDGQVRPSDPRPEVRLIFESKTIERDYDITYQGVNVVDNKMYMDIVQRMVSDAVGIEYMTFNEETERYESTYNGNSYVPQHTARRAPELVGFLDPDFSVRSFHPDSRENEELAFLKWAGTYIITLTFKDGNPWKDCLTFGDHNGNPVDRLEYEAEIYPVDVYVDFQMADTTYGDTVTWGRVGSDGESVTTLGHYFYTINQETGAKEFFDIKATWPVDIPNQSTPDGTTGWGHDVLHTHAIIDGVEYCRLGGCSYLADGHMDPIAGTDNATFSSSVKFNAGEHTVALKLISERNSGLNLSGYNDKRHWQEAHIVPSYNLMTEGSDVLLPSTWKIEPKKVDTKVTATADSFVFDGRQIVRVRDGEAMGHNIILVDIGDIPVEELDPVLKFTKQLDSGELIDVDTAIEAGFYYVTVTFAANPNYAPAGEDAKVLIRINQAEVSLAVDTPQSREYNGEALEVGYRVTGAGLVPGYDPKVQVLYRVRSDNDITAMDGVPVDASLPGESYFALVRLAQDGNYKLADGKYDVLSDIYTIAKARRVVQIEDFTIENHYNRISVIFNNQDYCDIEIGLDSDTNLQVYDYNTVTGLQAQTSYALYICVPESRNYYASDVLSTRVVTGYDPGQLNKLLAEYGVTLTLDKLQDFRVVMAEYAKVSTADLAEVDQVAYNNLRGQYDALTAEVGSVISGAQSIAAKSAHKAIAGAVAAAAAVTALAGLTFVGLRRRVLR